MSPADALGSPDAATDPRTAQLAGNLRAVRARIGAACAAAGRDPGEVALVVVTKTHPAQDVRRLAALGVRRRGREPRPGGGGPSTTRARTCR